MAPKFGVNAWVWDSPVTTQSVERLAPWVAEQGFDALEIPIENLADWDDDSVVAILKSAGLRASVCGVFGAGRELCATDAGTIRGTQDYLLACLDKAAAIGSPVVGGPFYSSVGRTWRVTRDVRIRLVAEVQRNLKPVAERALELGVVLAIEPLNRYETSLINTVSQALELLEPLDPRSVGILFDTFHANIEESSVTNALRQASTRLVHVQASASDRGTPGKDHIDWRAVAAQLTADNYRGMVVIESFTSQNDAIATAASIWRDLAPTQDLLASDGLRALHGAWSG